MNRITDPGSLVRGLVHNVPFSDRLPDQITSVPGSVRLLDPFMYCIVNYIEIVHVFTPGG